MTESLWTDVAEIMPQIAYLYVPPPNFHLRAPTLNAVLRDCVVLPSTRHRFRPTGNRKRKELARAAMRELRKELGL